jgi:hypothetical protein
LKGPSQSVSSATKEAVSVTIKKGSRNRFVPDVNAKGAHTAFRKDPLTSKISHYETFVPQTNPRNPNPWESLKRYDGPGGDKHWNKVLNRDIYSPHVHDPLAPGGVREPKLREIPKN